MPLSSAHKAATDAHKANRAPTSVSPQEVHRWLQSFNWDFANNRTKYPTKYKMANDTKEQFKLIAKEYARMESVKDERQFGTLLDGMTRLGAGNRMHPRWGETMKVASNFLEVGEYNAISGSAMLWDSRHRRRAEERLSGPGARRNPSHPPVRASSTTTTPSIITIRLATTTPAAPAPSARLWKGMKRVFADGFISGDAVECSINLQLVGEACFTNPLIVAITEWASANGDEITPTVFLSIETDELRHMANGYQTIVSIANDPASQKYLNSDLNNAFWTQQKYFTPVLGMLVRVRLEVQGRAVGEDLEPLGVRRLGRNLDRPSRQVRRAVASVAARRQAGRLLGAPRPRASRLRAVADRLLPPVAAGRRRHGLVRRELSGLGRPLRQDLPRVEGPRLRRSQERLRSDPVARQERPHRFTWTACRRCRSARRCRRVPSSLRVHEFNGKKHSFSDDWGERMWLTEPERYECQNVFEQYAGRELSEIVVEGHGVRSDGKTLIGQPHVRGDNLWTVEDLKRADVVCGDPAGAV